MTDTPTFTMDFLIAPVDAPSNVIAITELMRAICARQNRRPDEGLQMLLIAAATHWNWYANDRMDMVAFAEHINTAFKWAADWFPLEEPGRRTVQ